MIDAIHAEGSFKAYTVVDYVVKDANGRRHAVPSWDSSLTLVRPGEKCPVCGSEVSGAQ